MNNREHEAYVNERGVTGLDLELCEIENHEQMKRLRDTFRLRFPCFMANIVKMLLYRGEEKLACLLTSYYEISIDENMINKAVINNNYEWLRYVYCFGKNFLGVRRFPVDLECFPGSRATRASYLSIEKLFELVKLANERSFDKQTQ